MNSQDYSKIQTLRKQLHEAKTNNTNESNNKTVENINEQLVKAGCGIKQINE